MKGLLAILGLFASTTVGAFDFKGIEIGGPASYTMEEVRTALLVPTSDKDRIECKDRIDDTFDCSGVLAGVGSVELTALDSGRVMFVSVKFTSSQFDEFVKALTRKFGPPTESSAVTIYAMGSPFEKRVRYWKGKDGRYVVIANYGDTIHRGFIDYGSKDYKEWQNRRNAVKPGSI